MAKTSGRIRRIRTDMGRGDQAGVTHQARHHYFYALLLTKGRLDARSWDDMRSDAWAEPGFQERCLALCGAWLSAPTGAYALVTLSNAPTFTEGLTLMPLSTLEAAKFFSRHPERTLHAVLTFAVTETHAQDAGQGTQETS